MSQSPWLREGHLTEEALTAMADGQDILPAEASAHLDSCGRCAEQLGQAALLSLSVGAALATGASLRRAPAAAPAPLPAWALVLGLAAVLGAATPFLLSIPAWLPRTVFVLERCLPVLVHGLVAGIAELGREGPQRLAVSMVSLAVLMMSAFAVSRLTPREGVPQ